MPRPRFTANRQSANTLIWRRYDPFRPYRLPAWLIAAPLHRAATGVGDPRKHRCRTTRPRAAHHHPCRPRHHRKPGTNPHPANRRRRAALHLACQPPTAAADPQSANPVATAGRRRLHPRRQRPERQPRPHPHPPANPAGTPRHDRAPATSTLSTFPAYIHMSARSVCKPPNGSLSLWGRAGVTRGKCSVSGFTYT